MALVSRCCAFVLTCVLLAIPAVDQQSGMAPPAATSDPSTASATAEQQSLADIARGLRKNKQAEVQISPEDAKELFRQVDKIFQFASTDTGLPQKSPVKRRLVGQADVENFVRERMAKAEYAQRFARSELTMKKFGLLPRDFDLRNFLVKANGQEIAGFYDEQTKVISLLNWVPLDKQEPILAHELTHALQDQNYNLKTWMKAAIHQSDARQSAAFEVDDGESATARHAVTEGQAMVVYFDYMLAPYGRNLKDTPGLVASMEDPSVTAVIDTPIMHSAPIVLREAGAFPYREGLFFEAALLERGGKQLAFAGALSHPPRNTHEVLQPDTYLHSDKLQPLHIPDLRPLVSDRYELYDSGGFGELDVRALLKQLGDKKAATELSPAWRGGAYVAFRRTATAVAAATSKAPADVALVYLSRWKTPEAAQHFAKLYAGGVAKRYKTADLRQPATCAGKQCPVSTSELSTEEGPVIIEQWPDNTLLISESFDENTAAKLRNAVLDKASDQSADLDWPSELTLRLYSLPGFREFQTSVGARILEAVSADFANQQPR